MMTEYAVYKGDEFLDIGTVKELSKKFNVTRKTVQFWNSKANKRRCGENGNRIIAIRIEED